MIFTSGQFWPSGIVVDCVYLCVFMCVRVCEPWACLCNNSSPIQARIIKDKSSSGDKSSSEPMLVTDA